MEYKTITLNWGQNLILFFTLKGVHKLLVENEANVEFS